jgi:hypothetical protein
VAGVHAFELAALSFLLETVVTYSFPSRHDWMKCRQPLE